MRTLSSPTQTSQSLTSIQNRFRLITYIDRINFFSDIYIAHYKQVFDTQEFRFVLHWKGQDELKNYLKKKGFTENNFIYNGPLRRNFGYGEQCSKQNFLKREFLREGYIVVYADMDELIYHPSFKSYIINSPTELFCAKGVQIIQGPNDPYLNITQPICKQRKLGNYDPWASKVCVLKKDFKWTPGRHNREGVAIDNNLWLFDIGRVCKKLMLENNIRNTELYSGIYPRYRLCTKEGVEQEYAEWVKNMSELPKEFTDTCLF